MPACAVLIAAMAVAATSAARSPFCPLGYDYGPAAGWDNMSDPLLWHPRFHVMPPTRKDAPTGMNDYNALFTFRGVYHISYQDHIHCPDDVNQANQSFSHVVTTDLVYLVHLPPMLTDDPTFDGRLGPWDGPGFVCNGVPTVIYNSHAEGDAFGLQTKTAATPVDTGDPMLTAWKRHPLDPADAFIGPGTLPPPWLSSDGSKLYAFAKPANGTGCWLWETNATSGSCTSWRVASQNFTDPKFCFVNNPELWPLPRPCPGCPTGGGGDGIGGGGHTHVLKYTAGEYDAYVFGTLVGEPAGPPSFVPSGAPEQLYEFPKARQFEDGRGAWSESMLTVDGARRFYIAWVPPGVSPAYHGPKDLPAGCPPLWHTSTSMREIFYDARLRRLTFAPIQEYEKLRAVPAGPTLAAAALGTNGKPGATPLGSARQFDIEVNFTAAEGGVPFGSAFGVRVFAAPDGTGGVGVAVACTNGTGPTELPPGTDLPGSDLRYFAVDPSYTPAQCAAACANTTGCKAWTLAQGVPGGRFPPYRCCLKDAVPAPHPNPKCTSGVMGASPQCTVTVNTTGSGDVPGHTVSSPVATLAAPLLPGDDAVHLRVLGDRSIVEVFAVAGRAVVTATAYPPPGSTSLFAWANTSGVVVSGQANAMGCAWVEANVTSFAE